MEEGFAVYDILQYYFDKGDNASQACEKICGVYGEGTVTKSAARECFARFRSRNFDVSSLVLVDQLPKKGIYSFRKN